IAVVGTVAARAGLAIDIDISRAAAVMRTFFIRCPRTDGLSAGSHAHALWAEKRRAVTSRRARRRGGGPITRGRRGWEGSPSRGAARRGGEPITPGRRGWEEARHGGAARRGGSPSGGGGALLGDGVAAVHDHVLPGYIGRARAGQPGDGGGDLLG